MFSFGHLKSLLATLLLLLLFSSDLMAVRVKDVANLRGARDNQLIGFGIVVGLDGTGDSPTLLSRKPVINALERVGISLQGQDIQGRSIAAVWVTATLPAFAKSGQRLDAHVATIGDAISLRGGVLILAPLRAPNRLVYAVAQGPVSGIPRGVNRMEILPIPGVIPNVPGGSQLVASVGMVPGGALVEREVNLNLNSRARIYMNLSNPDFTTAFRLSKLINQTLGYKTARAKDAGTVEILVPQSYLGKTVELVSYIENLQITPDNIAQVLLDERSGTVVMGGHVRIAPIAISQGGLSIQVKGNPAQQPQQQNPNLPPVQTGLQANVFLFKGGADLKEIVDGFNKIGASSKDLIDVLKAIKTAGALHADLVIR